MFGFETNQRQINKLQNKLNNLEFTVNGGIFEDSLAKKYNTLKDIYEQLDKKNRLLSDRLSVLEEIVKESGLITDFDKDEVKIREDRKFDIFNGINVKQVPYQINKVKVV